jgi:flavin-dependent dehydrogenase
MTGERFDAIVIGAGPAGEVVASRLGAHGLATALVEQELSAAKAQTRWADVAEYREYLIRNLDDEDEVEGYEEQGRSFRPTPRRTSRRSSGWTCSGQRLASYPDPVRR